MRTVLSFIVLAVLDLACAPLMHADIATLLTLDDEAGDIANIEINKNNTVFCTGNACGTLGFLDPAHVYFSGPSASPGYLPHGTIGIVNGTLGQFTINLTANGEATAVSPDLMSLSGDFTSIGADTLVITFSDTEYFSSGGLSLTSSGTANPFGSSANVCGSDDPTDATPAGNEFGCVNGFGSTGVPVNPPPGEYSLSQQITIYQVGAGTTTLTDPAIIATPEPAAVVLAGTMFLLTLLSLRRRFAQRATDLLGS